MLEVRSMIYLKWLRALAIGIVLGAGLVGSAALAEDTLPQDPPRPEELAGEVEAENAEYGNATVWRGGRIGQSGGADLMLTYGQKFPGFALETPDGEPVIMDRLDGPKLIHFWSTWCMPCIDEFPDLVDAALSADTPFTLLFVDVWEEASALDDFLTEQPQGLSVLVSGDLMASSVGLVAIPTSVLVDADGTIQVIHIGNITPSVMTFIKAVAGELAAAG
jgi:thiol-disulfide isomerase/thioredoxin